MRVFQRFHMHLYMPFKHDFDARLLFDDISLAMAYAKYPIFALVRGSCQACLSGFQL